MEATTSNKLPEKRNRLIATPRRIKRKFPVEEFEPEVYSTSENKEMCQFAGKGFRCCATAMPLSKYCCKHIHEIRQNVLSQKAKEHAQSSMYQTEPYNSFEDLSYLQNVEIYPWEMLPKTDLQWNYNPPEYKSNFYDYSCEIINVEELEDDDFEDDEETCVSVHPEPTVDLVLSDPESIEIDPECNLGKIWENVNPQD